MRRNLLEVTPELINQVKTDLLTMSGKEAAVKNNISRATVSNINTGKFDDNPLHKPENKYKAIWDSILSAKQLGAI